MSGGKEAYESWRCDRQGCIGDCGRCSIADDLWCGYDCTMEGLCCSECPVFLEGEEINE